MEAFQQEPGPDAAKEPINWESFYVNYRTPGYVPGYEIVNKLGGGVFGVVFKARKESIGKDYAIKFLKVDDEIVRESMVTRAGEVVHPRVREALDQGAAPASD